MTYSILKMVKEGLNADTIKKMTAKPKKSHFGKFKGLGEFKREEIDRFD